MVTNGKMVCPKCDGKLKHYDTVKRIVRTKGGCTAWIKIKRVYCTRCGAVHRRLPNTLLPFKQYEAEVIFGVLDGIITCSVLEMMIALSIRCEEHIMDDPDIGDRTGQWFWAMIASLGLGSMYDARFDRDRVDDILARFLERDYARNGEGGLFTVNLCRQDILYARLMGYTNEQLYNLSQRIISTDKKAKSNNCFFGEAYNVSYTDVYDFCSKKQSLKKWEIELGIHHQELGLPWDQPVPKNMWLKVAEYCDNDVIATEAVFNARKADFVAREILADVAGLTVNDTTNTLTARIIFGGNRKPQDQFNYRDMGDTTQIFDPEADLPFAPEFDQYTAFDKKKRPIFPGYKFENGKSIYRGEEVGEGGYVYAEPGMYGNIALLDIASMHPSSIIAEELFGPEYTKRFQEIKDARVAIKHKDFDKARKMLNGALAKYLTDEGSADALAQALKIAISSSL